MKVGFYTLGCKVNTYESEVLMNKFKKEGYEIVDFNDKADIYVINTCSVTNTSDQKSRKIIREASRNNKDAIICVMGCYSQLNHEDIKFLGDNIAIILGNNDKSKLLDYINEYKKNKKQIVKIDDLNKVCFEDMRLDSFEKHTRAFVKIQDGCNNYCSYCIIPYTRGNVRSKKKEDVLDEINTLVKNGYKEVVLTGIHTGHYGQDLKDYDFSDLLRELEQIDGLERIRISSVEITELNDKFLETLKNSKKIVNHIHIPIQSLCDKTLKDMNRKYDVEYFFNKINEIRSIRPNIAITSDVIVGFPNETDEDFNTTKENIRKLGITELHVFPYSIRKGTRAASMPQVDGNIKKQRVKELINLSEELKNAYYTSLIGTNESVLTEKYIDGYLIGHLSNYGLIKVKSDTERLNEIIEVKLISYKDDIFTGEIIKK
jgi:threonylcarbamoyladenosine tRNA methylthiotransferase MtaB